MDKKYLKEHNLFEAHKQFMRLCEWSYVPTTLEEEGEDNQDQNQEVQDSNMGENPNMQPTGGDGNMPSMEGESNGEGDMAPMDQNMGQEDGQMDPNMDGNMPVMDQNMGEEPNMPLMDGGEDETVIDVEDITNAQEKMNSKVNVVGKDLGEVNDKIESLMQLLNKMEGMITNNNKEIANFKAEFEKRNPTQTEKLNLRSLDSYPFNVNPKDYWAQKGADPNSNYSGFANNGKSTTQEYVITNNDVDDFNEREMESSFDIEDDLKQDISKIFGLS